MKKLALVLAFLLVCAAASRAQNDTIVTTAPAGTDSVDWTQFNSPSPNGGFIDGNGDATFALTTTDLIAGTGTWGGGPGSAGTVVTEGIGFVGDFGGGQVLNYDNDNGPLTLTFTGSGYTQIGAQIESTVFGPYIAQICDVTTSFCVQETGTNLQAEQGTTIYLGIYNASSINSVTFSLLSVNGFTSPPAGPGDLNDFAISDVTLGGAPLVNVPEGGASLLYLLLAGASLCGAIFLRSRSGFIKSEAA